MDNLKIYNQFRSVPKEAQKTILAGKLKGFTDINPMWRIKMLTEAFGMCGEGWMTTDVKMWTETAGGETAAFVSLNLLIKAEGKWSDPIFGIGGSKLAGKGVGDGINDEAFKMAYTDALSIACKNLGMAADIYFANDRTKYDSVQEKATPVKKVVKAVSPAPGYTPMDNETYWRIIAAYAQGKRTKTGGDYKEAWRTATNADKEASDRFDQDVDNWRAANLNAEQTRRVPVQDI